MRRMHSMRILLAAGRILGVSALLALAVAVVLGPVLLEREPAPETAGNGVGGGRDVEAELTDYWASEGFSDLALAVAALPDEPNWETVKTLMEARGCTGLRYALRIGWRQDDGLVDDLTYIRRPYEEPWHFQEFMRLLKGDLRPAEFLARFQHQAVEISPDDRREPERLVQKLLESQRPGR